MTSTTPVHVWRLDITYPEHANTPGWAPDAWEAPDPHAVFRWPPNKLCLSHKTAKRRARMFESYGCYVTIHKSLPVYWPDNPRDASAAVKIERTLEDMRRHIERLDADRHKLAVALEWRKIAEERKNGVRRVRTPRIPGTR